MDRSALNALTETELREAKLLSWGAVGAEWTEDELLSILSAHGGGSDILDELVESALIVRTPRGGYRSRSAETIRLLATLRQAFWKGRVTHGRPLVLDYRFLHRPRRRPERNVPAQSVLTEIGAVLGMGGSTAAQALLPERLSGFQRRSTNAVLEALKSGRPSGVMVSAGTGSGKTLAFYLPLLSWLADQREERRASGPLALALYPRNELLKDQLRALLGYVRRIRAGQKPDGRPLSLATWFGLTPSSAYAVRQGWAEGWQRRGGGDFVCPYLRCLECDADLLWRRTDIVQNRERLVCSTPSCGFDVDGRVLRLTRDSARRDPADLMLSTTESLNRQLGAPGNLRAFGVRPSTLAAVLLDEVHTYEGTTGAQNAILLRRLTHALGHAPVWAGLSATLRNAGDFFAQLTGLRPGDVTVVQPDAEEMEESGAEYLLALRHDPHSRTGTISTSIQTCMALARCLDSMDDDPFDPPPSSEGVFGSRLFVFTDKLDSTNRLFWDLLDAEGWRWPGRLHDGRRVLTLAHLRAEQQERLPPEHREPKEERDSDGQWWWLPERLGHGIEADRSLQLGRTSSQDRGVAADAQVVIATATLEVGFDDERVGAVVQHKAPHDPAQFLQRKGRAGRNPMTRPWTVVVLSDWGRDRQAWEAYDALFDPELPPRSLPLENLYVLRIQAVYALLDWLAVELRYSGRDSIWEDLAGPAVALHSNSPERQRPTLERQKRIVALLALLLRPGPERQRLRLHLRSALGLGFGDWADSVVDSLLWDAPRPLLPVVVPTIRRRLRDQWAGEQPQANDAGLRTRTPLRQFVPGNLFDDLLVPDVEVAIPGRRHEVQAVNLPALRVLGEFCPGNVSRHFGIWATNKRHWIPLRAAGRGAEEQRIDIRETYRSLPVDVVETAEGRVTVYTPTAAALEAVPDQVRDASAVRPDWELQIAPLGAGYEVRVSRGADRLITRLTGHLHAQGGGVRMLRYARTASGTIWDPRARPVRLDFGVESDDSWAPAALGVDVQCDALTGTIRFPRRIPPPDAEERTQRLRHYLQNEARLPSEMSAFDRESLVDIVLLAVTAARVNGEAISEDGLSAAMRRSATILGPDTDDEELGGRFGAAWTNWCADPQVLAAVRGALAEVEGTERSVGWTSWWRRRYTLSTAQVALAALSALCPGVNTDELMVDLDPVDDSRFWVSEPAPGGTGQIEAFVRALTQEPAAFTRALEDALIPSTIETMDQELTALIREDASEIRSALAELRESWPKGHAAVANEVQRLDDAARVRDLVLGGPARSALSTRIAGPGAHPDLPAAIRYWLDLRDIAMERSRFAVEGRTLGALLADETAVDEVLHLGAGTTRQQRARAVTNVLWPWGMAAQPSLSYNPYAPRLHGSMSAPRALVDLRPPKISAVPWDGERREAIHDALREYGEIVLQVPNVQRADLRTVLLDLQTRPVEVGTLLCHPVVVGARTTERHAEARLLLREAL
ncbi:protein DpdJ [Allonocardiopsis opalescens]|uniref:Helicase-like protein n=1 Tax=Allonocardiopsis opalescens TaxID=1144618 RepID=A0A2T0Q2J7_9ACTN|nr:protein DpdJ [Allonocardiopsis opalescens]PRX98009.1 helicase-like protein [Allonocardiopsis opalescens]